MQCNLYIVVSTAGPRDFWYERRMKLAGKAEMKNLPVISNWTLKERAVKCLSYVLCVVHMINLYAERPEALQTVAEEIKRKSTKTKWLNAEERRRIGKSPKASSRTEWQPPPRRVLDEILNRLSNTKNLGHKQPSEFSMSLNFLQM